MGSPLTKFLLVAVLVAFALAACGDDRVEAGGGDPVDGAVETGQTGVAAGRAVTEVRHGVGYYGACGNEVLTGDDLTLYPLLPDELADLDAANYPIDAEELGLAPLRVAEAGPGDDVGTLIIYEDGMAYFASDSGDFLIWLSDTPRTYPWEC